MGKIAEAIFSAGSKNYALDVYSADASFKR